MDPLKYVTKEKSSKKKISKFFSLFWEQNLSKKIGRKIFPKKIFLSKIIESPLVYITNTPSEISIIIRYRVLI